MEGKTATGRGDIISSETYGTSRANAYKILEETLNLKDVRIYDTIEDAEGKPKRVLNKRETMLAQQKQQVIKDAFANWVWQDPQRRIALVRQYNELFNSTRSREYDGSHIKFVGMNPEITLLEHQRNAIAHVLYAHFQSYCYIGQSFLAESSDLFLLKTFVHHTSYGCMVWFTNAKQANIRRETYTSQLMKGGNFTMNLPFFISSANEKPFTRFISGFVFFTRIDSTTKIH